MRISSASSSLNTSTVAADTADAGGVFHRGMKGMRMTGLGCNIAIFDNDFNFVKLDFSI